MLGKNSADSVLKGLVEIPEGTLRIRPLGIDVEVPMHERENERSQEEFSIPTYTIINTLLVLHFLMLFYYRLIILRNIH